MFYFLKWLLMILFYFCWDSSKDDQEFVLREKDSRYMGELKNNLIRSL